ncbi:hypothetical protein HY640_03950 [Candidatus Woesearchaeota archaeon]|nr:hypothetical protein [Candidatus Woesearchaeota archaeon]
MAKLPNQRVFLRVFLDELVTGGNAELVSVSDLTEPNATDPEGVPWRKHVMKEYEVQKHAIRSGTLAPGKELLPQYAIEVLKDPTEENYTVMTLIFPSNHSHRFQAVGMIRPDVVRLGDGTPYIKLWYGPIVRESFRGTSVLRSGRNLTDILMTEAIGRMKPTAGEDPMIFVDSDNSLHPDQYLRYGFTPMISGLHVPDLRAEGAAKDEPFSTVSLYVRMPKGRKLPPSRAWEMVKDYLVKGYEAPEKGTITHLAADRLARQLL